MEPENKPPLPSQVGTPTFCEGCGGTGTIIRKMRFSIKIPCPVCKGTGSRDGIYLTDEIISEGKVVMPVGDKTTLMNCGNNYDLLLGREGKVRNKHVCDDQTYFLVEFGGDTIRWLEEYVDFHNGRIFGEPGLPDATAVWLSVENLRVVA